MMIISFILTLCVLRHLVFLFVRYTLNKINQETTVDYNVIAGASAA